MSANATLRARFTAEPGSLAVLRCIRMDWNGRTFDATELRGLLARVGELAADRGERVELIVLGGAAVALLFRSRRTTRSIDVVSALPSRELVAELAGQIAEEDGLSPSWFSDEAMRFTPNVLKGALIFEGPGIRVHAVALEQLLASKLDAMRDDVDRADAIVVAAELGIAQSSTEQLVAPYIAPERFRRACEELADIWQEVEDARR